MTMSLEDAYVRIVRAGRPEEIFGPPEGGDADERLAHARRAYLELVRVCHPDRYAGDAMQAFQANEAMVILNTAWEEAQRALASGSYGRAGEGRDEEAAGASTIETDARRYTVSGHAAEGDVAHIYRGSCRMDDGSVEEVAIKIAADAADNDLLDTEIRALETLAHKSLPVLLDSFYTEDQKRGLVCRWIDGVDLLTLRDRLPEGLPEEHVVWVFERLLSVLGFVHRSRIIHGNIQPSHIMVRPRDHNAFLVDYTYALLDPGRTGRGFKGATEGYSAPEVYERKPPIPPSDLYSLAKCMLYLLGGDPETQEMPTSVDVRLQYFVKSFLARNPLSREGDAWAASRKLGVLRERIFGQRHEFLPLEIP